MRWIRILGKVGGRGVCRHDFILSHGVQPIRTGEYIQVMEVDIFL